MRIVGIILLVLGIVGVVIFGLEAMNDSESFSILGADIAVSKADWTPLIISAVILIIGAVLSRSGKKA
jgi:NO-binding membrane sensor protein with MHYT domain